MRRLLFHRLPGNAAGPAAAQAFLPAVSTSSSAWRRAALDALARQIAQGASRCSSSPWWWRTSPGPAGPVGFQRLMKAEPDGHTLNFSNMSLTIIPHLYPKGGFDPVADLTPWRASPRCP